LLSFFFTLVEESISGATHWFVQSQAVLSGRTSPMNMRDLLRGSASEQRSAEAKLLGSVTKLMDTERELNGTGREWT